MSRRTANRSLFRAFSRGCRDVASVMVHAGRCSAAIEAGRRPDEHSLRVLGVDPARFDHISKF